MSRFLDDLAALIRKKHYPIYRIAEIRRGEEPHAISLVPANACQNSYSVAKSFTVCALGLLYDRGMLRPEDRITDILGPLCPPAMDPRWKLATVHMAIRHELGLPDGFLDIDAQDSRSFGRDYLGYLLSAPLLTDPGREFRYTDAAYYLLSRLVEVVAGEPMDSLLWRELFYPLGFTEVAWSRCPQGHPMGATGLYIKTEDMVRLGGLYLNEGCWDGHRILSEAWLRLVREREYEFYWSSPAHVSYGKSGMFGQRLQILPIAGRAVAWHGYGGEYDGELLHFAESYPDL